MTAEPKPAPDFLTTDLVRESLSGGTPLWLRVRSGSMRPSLQPDDRVWVVPLAERRPRPGEVLLYEGPAGLVLHRCLYSTGDRVRLKGDAAAALDPLVPLSGILGRAEKVRGGGDLSERCVGRRGGSLGAALSLAAIATRMLARRIFRNRQNSFRAHLGGFALEVTAPRIPRELLGKWLRHEDASGEVVSLTIRLDPILNHSDPFEIRGKPGPPRTLWSSAFILCKESSHGFSLRIAADVRDASRPCPNAVENGLRALLALLCEETPGCRLLHAAAFAFDPDGGAFVVPGRSGTGKTTLCRLLSRAGMPVAADDLLLLRTEGGPVRVIGTPFSGDGADIPKTPGPYRLRSWLLLEKAARHELAAASSARIAAAIAGALQRPGAGSGAAPGAPELALAAELVALAPGYRLAFAPEIGVGQYLKDHLNRAGGACE